MDNIDSHINVSFYYLSNKTNQRFVAFLQRFGVTSQNILINKEKPIKTVNFIQIYIMMFYIKLKELPGESGSDYDILKKEKQL